MEVCSLSNYKLQTENACNKYNTYRLQMMNDIQEKKNSDRETTMGHTQSAGYSK